MTDDVAPAGSRPHALSHAPVAEPLEARQLLSTYYVSANGGDDDAPGSLDEPFRTIQHAASLAEAGDTVLIRGGVYRETVAPENSGSAGAPITFKAYNGEKVTVSGADVVSGWDVHAGSVYKADQSWDLGFGDNQVFLDGRMMTEARWPNTTLDVSRPVKARADDLAASGSSGTLRDSALAESKDYWRARRSTSRPASAGSGRPARSRAPTAAR
jgi:hypothetical protein